MNRTIIVITAALLATLRGVAASSEGEDSITVGPKAGQTIRMLTHIATPALQASAQEGTSVWLPTPGGMTNVPVESSAYRWQCVRRSGEVDRSFSCYEFRLTARGGRPFTWSCWADAFPEPHGFAVFSTGEHHTYACYVADGIHLFQVTEPREPNLARREFWNKQQHPDALPVLPLDLLLDTVGFTNMLGRGPQSWNVVVEDVTKFGAQVNLTLHGEKAFPKYTFGLKDTEWTLVTK